MEDECAESPEAQARRAYATAVKLLGPRDHSRQELRRKLLKRDFDDDLVESTLDELESMNYLDDEAYACRFAEQRAGQGQGPLSIRAKLAERGVESRVISSAIDTVQLTWSEVASEALQRKFTPEQLADADTKVRGRIARFLASRGFSTADALAALRDANKEQAFD